MKQAQREKRMKQEGAKMKGAADACLHCLGVISDTHGVLPQEAVDALMGAYDETQVYEQWFSGERRKLPQMKSEMIVHAGDILRQSTLDELEAYAPVLAVNGNCDYGDFFTKRGWTRAFESFIFHGVRIAVLHKPSDLRIACDGGIMQPAYIAPAPRLRIHGHTHTPRIVACNEHVLLCPGSPSCPREGTKPSIARVYVQEGDLIAIELVELI